MPNSVIYARVSTARQADEGLPVESQLERCRELAASIGATVLREFRDDGISGRTSQRPAFRDAIDFCESHDVDFFICWSTSRFARNRIDAALNKRMLEKIGVKLRYVAQDFGESDEAWLTEAITELMDEQYSRSIAKDTRRSMRKNAKDGFFNGGRVPFGFQSAPVGKRRKLEIVESEAAIVRSIFRWSKGGEGAKSIAMRLNSEGYSCRGQPWSKQRVNSVLTSEAVAGRTIFTEAGERISTDSHPAIIQPDEFEAVSASMSSRAPNNVGARHRSQAIFSGMIRCGHCDNAMMTETATSRNGSTYRYYNCRGFIQGLGCSSRRRRVDDLDKHLLSAVLDQIFTQENMRWIAQDLMDQGNEDVREYQERIDALGIEAADIKRRLRRLFETIEAGAGLSVADVAPRIKELREREKEIEKSVAELDAKKPTTPMVSVERAMAAAEYFREVIETSDSPKKVREFLSQFVKKASILDTTAVIEYWPERLVTAAGGSQCVISWLPDLGSNQGPTD